MPTLSGAPCRAVAHRCGLASPCAGSRLALANVLMSTALRAYKLLLVTSQITVPIFAIVHLPSIITLSTAWFTPGGWMYIIM
jgi:hypothetical protein